MCVCARAMVDTDITERKHLVHGKDKTARTKPTHESGMATVGYSRIFECLAYATASRGAACAAKSVAAAAVARSLTSSPVLRNKKEFANYWRTALDRISTGGA
jgi:hypothetical protein